MCCFFFKQKTAYEMRISDWSSDVCSSDLHAFVGRGAKCPVLGVGGLDLDHAVEQVGMEVARNESGAEALDRVRSGLAARNDGRQGRSEEHTSELQSLMRISYAVFCLKKKKKKTTKDTMHNEQEQKHNHRANIGKYI